MKKTLNLVLVLSILLAIGLACEATTANLSEITFATDKKGENEVKSAKAGETTFAIASLNNAGVGYKLLWKTYVKNVPGQKSGMEIKQLATELDAPGSLKTTYALDLPESFPNGKYKIELILINKDSGKEVDTKTATLTVKGGKDTSGETSADDSDNSDENSVEDSPNEDADDEDANEEDE